MEATGVPGRERLETGWLLAGAGAVLLLVSLFIDWYDAGSSGVTAWTVFEALDLFLAACAVVILAYAARAAGLRTVSPVTAALASVAALVVVVSQLIDPPPVASFDDDLEVGAWLALAGSVLMVAGALLSRTGTSFAVVIERRGPTDAEQTAPLPPDERPPPPRV